MRQKRDKDAKSGEVTRLGSEVEWVTLYEALLLVTKAVLSRELAEKLVVNSLFSGKMPWRCWHAEGRKRRGEPDCDIRNGLAAYWQTEWTSEAGAYGSRQRIQTLRIDWEASAAYLTRNSEFQYSVYRVEVPLAGIEALLGSLGFKLKPKAPPPVEPAKQDEVGWQVRRILEVLPDACPKPEGMTIVAVRAACAPAFEKRGWPLAGVDSFSRALNRRT